jgi:protein-tyrosine-phosphatase
MTNILFICKYNRFRSKISEAYFNKICSSEFKAKSAGLIRGNYPLDENQTRLASQAGIKMKGKPQGLSVDLLSWADILVIAADNIPLMLFKNQKRYGKRIIHWKIPDAHHTDINGIKNRIKLIKNHVEKFVKALERFD